MMRQLWLPPLGMIFCVLVTTWVIAQEPGELDPFGEAKAAPKAEAPAAEAKEKETAKKGETDPFVIDMLATKPTSSVEAMQLAINLINYGRADVAKQFVSKLVQARPNDAIAWQLHRKFGSAAFFRISSHADLQPEGRQLADLVLDGANRFAREPARLHSLIKQLSHEQSETRHAALVDLKDAGADAAVSVIQVLGDSSRSSEHGVLRAALVQMGDVAIGPLLGALESPQEGLRAQIMVVLGRLRATEAVPFLVRPYFTVAPGSLEQRAAQSALSNLMQELPSRAGAERILFRLVSEYFNGRLPGKLDQENKLALWQWNDAEKRPQAIRLDAVAAPILFAARLAGELVALAPENREYRLWQIASTLDAAKFSAGWDQPLPQGPGTAFALAAGNSESWDDVLRFSLDRGHIGAAIGLIEVIGAVGDESVVRSRGGVPRELVKALRHPNRRVQFAAVKSILKVGPQEPFAGASFVPETLGYFAGTTGSRRVIIAHPRPELSHNLSGILREAGVESDLTTNGAEAMQIAMRNSDVEFILLSDAIERPNVQEQVAQLRRAPRTAMLPIGVLARNENFDRLSRTFADDSMTEVFLQPADSEGVAFVMNRLMRRVERDWVAQSERIQQADAALDMLVFLAENSATLQFYELLPQQTAVEQALTVPTLTTNAARVLGLLGSPAAQQTLTVFVNQTGRPLEQRQAAAAAFEMAVARRGLLLTKAEILRQYDVYNGSANSDPGTQQVLGSILNTIEGLTSAKTSVTNDNTP